MDEDLDPRVARTRADVLTAAGQILLEDGWAGVTHARVADRAGYSKVTLYSHWPGPVDLLREAFDYIGELPHHAPMGNLEQDLIGELTAFRDVLIDQRFDRALAGLAERAQVSPDVAAIRDGVMRDGAAPMREMLHPHVRDDETVDVVVAALLGAVIYRIVLLGRDASPDFIERLVQRTLGDISDIADRRV